ncbi:hypothetical protein BOTCAL_0005g00220 [Botryotinia calthae]|uniref:Uncharacterized protein n=1 Tax=Botryotinia calthae TaxID=38488 RepID=A0A4Y8DJH4_9HELO|nr:hypothetical protein BOTCAL_0005g00220 [Botryotinia calthae]
MARVISRGLRSRFQEDLRLLNEGDPIWLGANAENSGISPTWLMPEAEYQSLFLQDIVQLSSGTTAAEPIMAVS